MAWSRLLIAAWIMLSAAQWLAAIQLFEAGGLLDWQRLAQVSGRWVQRVQRRVPKAAPSVLFLVQLALALLLAILSALQVTIACLAALLVCRAVFIVLTGEFWADGAEKIAMVVMVGTLVSALGLYLGDPVIAFAGILLSGGQLSLSYFVAGASKLFVPGWREGDWLASVLATGMWGESRLPSRLRKAGFAVTASWAVILLELLFPLALLAPEPWLIAAMVSMLLFHVGTAILMGLNTFPWAFATAYPAVFLLGKVAREATGSVF